MRKFFEYGWLKKIIERRNDIENLKLRCPYLLMLSLSNHFQNSRKLLWFYSKFLKAGCRKFEIIRYEFSKILAFFGPLFCISPAGIGNNMESNWPKILVLPTGWFWSSWGLNWKSSLTFFPALFENENMIRTEFL